MLAPLIAAGAAGGPIVFGIAVVASIIGELLLPGLLGGGSTKQLSQAINQMRSGFSQAIDQVTRFSWSVAFALGTLLEAVAHMFVEFLSRMWEILKRLADLVKKVVTDVLPAILKAIKNARRLLNKLYTDYIRPVLNALQKVRRYLAILRALHIPFADKLDKIIVRLESKIIGPYLYALRLINGVGQWVNVILTAKGTIQKPIFMNSMYQYQDSWINLFWAAQAGASSSYVAPASLSTQAPPTAAESLADLRTFEQSGTGPLAPVVAQAFKYYTPTQVT